MIADFVRNVAGLFYDDRSLAISVLLIVGTTYLLVFEFRIEPWLAGIFLLAGTLMALALGTLKSRPSWPRQEPNASVKNDSNS
jgi:hypothetical protein